MCLGVLPNSSQILSSDVHLSLESWVFITIFSILIPLILALNICVLLAILKNRHLRTGSNLFLVSLAVADICIGIFFIPGAISSHFNDGEWGSVVCIGCAYVEYSSVAAAVLSLAFLSVDRYRAVLYPLKPKLSKRQAGLIITAIWLTAFLCGLRGGLIYCSREIVIRNNTQPLKKVVCSPDITRRVLNQAMAGLDFVFIFLIPAITICVCYSAILCTISKSPIRRMRNPSTGSRGSVNIKAVRMSLVLVFIFVVCHLPEHALRVSISLTAVPDSFILLSSFVILSSLNSVLNPVLYGLLNPRIRNGLQGAFVKCCRDSRCGSPCCQSLISPTNSGKISESEGKRKEGSV